MASQEEFDKAVADSRKLPDQSPQNLLALYGLFKQATAGNVTGKKPGRLNMKARAKFEAWESQSGKSQDDARAEYVALVAKLGS